MWVAFFMLYRTKNVSFIKWKNLRKAILVNTNCHSDDWREEESR